MVLSPEDAPTRVEVAGVIGPYEIHTLDDLKSIRAQQVQFLLAKLVLEKYYRPEPDEPPKTWLFPQLVEIARQWYEECVDCKDDAFPQLLYFSENAHNAADRIIAASPRPTQGHRTSSRFWRRTSGSGRPITSTSTLRVPCTQPATSVPSRTLSVIPGAGSKKWRRRSRT